LKRFSLEAEKAFGFRNESLVMTIPRKNLPENVDFKEGEYIPLEDADIPRAKILNVTKSTVTLDANHPLAGKSFILEIELIDIARKT